LEGEVGTSANLLARVHSGRMTWGMTMPAIVLSSQKVEVAVAPTVNYADG